MASEYDALLTDEPAQTSPYDALLAEPPQQQQYVPQTPDLAEQTQLATQFQQEHPIVSNAIQAAGETIAGFTPKSLSELGGFAAGFEPVIGGVENVGRAGKSIYDVLFGGKTLDESARTNFPESQIIKSAEQTPAFSKERFAAGFNVLGQLGMATAIGRSLPLRDILFPTEQAAPLTPATEAAVKPTIGEPNASKIESTTPPDGGMRTRSQLGELPQGNVETTDARLRGNAGEVAPETRQGIETQPQEKVNIPQPKQPTEPWQLTQKQYGEQVLSAGPDFSRRMRPHRELVQEAINRGEPVPSVVLQDYPDLQAKVGQAQQEAVASGLSEGEKGFLYYFQGGEMHEVPIESLPNNYVRPLVKGGEATPIEDYGTYIVNREKISTDEAFSKWQKLAAEREIAPSPVSQPTETTTAQPLTKEVGATPETLPTKSETVTTGTGKAPTVHPPDTVVLNAGMQGNRNAIRAIRQKVFGDDYATKNANKDLTLSEAEDLRSRMLGNKRRSKVTNQQIQDIEKWITPYRPDLSATVPKTEGVPVSEGGAGLGQPKIATGDLKSIRAKGAYSPASGEITLDRESLAKMSPEERAALVRHEIAHKVDTEGELWKKSDTFLWDLWKKDKNNPLFQWWGEFGGKGKVEFNNEISSEMLAELYAKHYETGKVPYFDITKGYTEHPIPKELMGVLKSIDEKTGIYAKRAARTAKPELVTPPEGQPIPGGLKPAYKTENGNVYTSNGATHSEALDQAFTSEPGHENGQMGFVDQNGKFLDRNQAHDVAVKTKGEKPPVQAPESGISTERLQKLYGKDSVIINRGKGPQEWQRIGQADTRDPYAVLSKARENGIATPADTALLRAEHQRLLAKAREAYGTPEYNDLAQQAVDFANGTKEVAHGPASDVFRALQDVDKPKYDSAADFDNIVRERLNRETTPAEKAVFEKSAAQLNGEEQGMVKSATESQAKLRTYKPKEVISFDEAVDHVRNQIAALTRNCL